MRRRIAAGFGCGLGFLAAGCGPRTAPEAQAPSTFTPPPGAFSVVTWNLRNYGWDDRDGGGQPDDFKPEAEREAVAEALGSIRPDVLAIQEIGDAAALEDFVLQLGRKGLRFDYVHGHPRSRAGDSMAVFSRFPIVETRAHTNETYRIGRTELPVLRGVLDVTLEVAPNYRFRLMTAHLKSKAYHALGQTEMRRNEARLLGQLARRALKEDPNLNLLVVGSLNDDPLSAPLRECTGPEGPEGLIDLRPADSAGDVWTHFNGELDLYSRVDYLLASPGMALENLSGNTCVVRHPAAARASDHRPVLGFFLMRDQPPKTPAERP